MRSLLAVAFVLLSTGVSDARPHHADYRGYRFGVYNRVRCNLIPHLVRRDPLWLGCMAQPTFKERWPKIKYGLRPKAIAKRPVISTPTVRASKPPARLDGAILIFTVTSSLVAGVAGIGQYIQQGLKLP